MNRFMKQIPNMVTLIRIGAAISLFFIEPMSVAYLIVWGVCGFSDAVDGFLARKLHAESKFGSILDSFSDLFFYTVMVITLWNHILRTIGIPGLITAGVGLLFQLIGYIICAIKFHAFSALHTYANKILGVYFYLFPFALIGEIFWLYTIYFYTGAAIAIFGGLEVCAIHLINNKYDTSRKSIFLFLKKKKEEPEGEEEPAV